MRLSVLVKREQALDTGGWVWTALPQRTILELLIFDPDGGCRRVAVS